MDSHHKLRELIVTLSLGANLAPYRGSSKDKGHYLGYLRLSSTFYSPRQQGALHATISHRRHANYSQFQKCSLIGTDRDYCQPLPHSKVTNSGTSEVTSEERSPERSPSPTSMASAFCLLLTNISTESMA